MSMIYLAHSPHSLSLYLLFHHSLCVNKYPFDGRAVLLSIHVLNPDAHRVASLAMTLIGRESDRRETSSFLILN